MQLVESRHVLVVEDERVFAEDLQLTLTNLGYEVPLTVATAHDAIRAASLRCPDLVLMDIRIQGARGGFESAEILKSRFDVPIVYLTCHADLPAVARARSRGLHAYLLKPIKVDELRSAVEIALFKHGMERRHREREHWFACALRAIGDAAICRADSARQLASVGTLAAGVAHEINDPLSLVVANLDFALAELGKAQARSLAPPWQTAVEHALREAQLEAERATQVVAELCAFARPSRSAYRRLDVNRVVAATFDVIAQELRASACLVTEYGDVPEVIANEARLGQVFMNLLVNAAQAVAATGRPGEVKIRTSTCRDGHALIEVHDGGCGMNAEVQRKIFDPFFTTHEPGRGAGLGLAVCHGVVSSLGGEIEVRSSFGQGSVFVVRLPAASQPAPLSPAAAAASRSSEPRVLIVDDEPMVRTTIARMLVHEYAVTLAQDAREVLSLISQGERFDVILTDVSMTGMTGIELHEALTIRHPDQARRMVFLSGGAFTGETVAFLRQMVHRHLEKPFALSQLRSVLQEQLETLGKVAWEPPN